MSDPVTLAAAALGAIGTIQQGRAARARSEHAAQTMEHDGEAARRQAALEADERRREASARAAALRARLAGSGLRVEGTPLDLLGQVAAEGELAALQEEYGGTLEGARRQARADASRAQGAARQRASRFAAGASLLRGISPLLR